MIPLAITMGDAAGVGPEIALRACALGELGDDTVLYGDTGILQRGMELLGLEVPLRSVAAPCPPEAGVLTVVDCGRLAPDDLQPGRVDARTGAAARAYVLQATSDCLAGKVAGLVTLPMNKEATQLAHPGFTGHTELIAQACGCERFSMMLATSQVACTHVSTHVSMAEAVRLVRRDRVLEVIRLTHQALSRFLEQPRLAVAGLNPHAGERGLFGDQEQTEIAPAIAAAREEGIDATGPVPGDTAFDIAWQGKAFTNSLCHALAYARRLTANTEKTDVAGDHP